MTSARPIRLGISACLLGQRVRYDGGHKRNRFIAGTFARYFEFVPVCPEVAIGLGVPRPPLRLVGSPAMPRAVGVEDPKLDVSSKLAAYGRRQARALDNLDGYLFKSRSPSCGVGSVQVFSPRGRAHRGHGVYAGAFLAAQPLLPAEEEDRLDEPSRRDHFLERVFAHHRWREFTAGGTTGARLTAFHAAHALQRRAHGVGLSRTLDRLAAQGRAHAYGAAFLRTFARPVTRAGHARALAYAARRIAGRFDSTQRAEWQRTLTGYRAGRLPLAAPVRLLRRYLRAHPDAWLAAQVYLYPDSREFALRYRR